MNRRKRAYNWNHHTDDFVNGVGGDRSSCRARYQQSSVDVFAKFVAIDQVRVDSRWLLERFLTKLSNRTLAASAIWYLVAPACEWPISFNRCCASPIRKSPHFAAELFKVAWWVEPTFKSYRQSTVAWSERRRFVSEAIKSASRASSCASFPVSSSLSRPIATWRTDMLRRLRSRESSRHSIRRDCWT